MSILAAVVRSTTPALSASVTPTTLSGETWGYGVGMTSSPAVVEALNGVPGYTYSWTRVSGSTSITATSSTSYSTYFQATMVAGTSVSAVFKCTVTDAASGTVDTANVSITLTCNNPGGGIIP